MLAFAYGRWACSIISEISSTLSVLNYIYVVFSAFLNNIEYICCLDYIYMLSALSDLPAAAFVFVALLCVHMVGPVLSICEISTLSFIPNYVYIFFKL